MDQHVKYSDSELLAMIAVNDNDAFTELYYRYKDKLYGFAFHLSGSQAEAEDLVQDVFSKLWERRGSLEGKALFGSYLYKMIRNFCIDHIRRFSREAALLTQLEKNTDRQPDADATILYNEMDAKLRNSIAHLPCRQREIYILHRDKGLKYSEIAAELGLSVSTVKNHFSRAQENLRKSLETDYHIGLFLPFFLIMLIN